MSDSEHATQTLVIEVDRVKYTQEKCSIFGAHEDGALFRDEMAVKMFSGPVRSGQRWTVVGGWKEDGKWGRQFVATFAALATPRTFDELASFLTSGLACDNCGEQAGQVHHIRGLRTADPNEPTNIAILCARCHRAEHRRRRREHHQRRAT